MSQGRHLDEANSLLGRSLAIRQRVLGPDHLHVAKTLHNRAGLMYKMVSGV